MKQAKETQKRKRIKKAAGLVGLAVFFYLAFDLVLNDYGLGRTLAEIAGALGGLLLPLAVSFYEK